MPPISWTSKWREGLGQEVVERLAVLVSLPELGVLAADLLVLEQLHLRLEVVDGANALLELPELLALADAEGALEDRHA
jgi:hypothetical protein